MLSGTCTYKPEEHMKSMKTQKDGLEKVTPFNQFWLGLASIR